MDKVIRYPNGLRLVVDHMPVFRSVAAGIWVGTGSSKENPENNGISHFIEHMIFKGTDKLSAFDIASRFEGLGASVNAFTSKECTCYYVKSIDEYTEKCLDILSGIFFDSAFVKQELDKERKVIIEEINMVEDSPEEICYDLSAKAIYGDSPLGYPILGPIENVLRFEKSDIDKYITEHYRPENIVISMAGNISLEQADKLVRKYILPRLSNDKYSYTPMAAHKAKSRTLTRIKDFEQANIALSYPSIKFNDKEFAVQSVLNVILGGGMSSRLFQSIREREGLAYSVYSSPSSFIGSGTMNIFLNFSAENTNKVLDATKNEINQLLTDGIGESEFSRAKAQLKSASVFAQESLQTIMSSMGKFMTLTGEVFDINERIKQFDSVTMPQVNEFARKVFLNKEVCVAYVGKEIDQRLLDIIK